MLLLSKFLAHLDRTRCRGGLHADTRAHGLDVFLPKIGIDGCGKETCTSLACYLTDHKLYHVSVSQNYAYVEFKEDCKKVFVQAGVEGTPTALLLANLSLDQVSPFVFTAC